MPNIFNNDTSLSKRLKNINKLDITENVIVSINEFDEATAEPISAYGKSLLQSTNASALGQSILQNIEESVSFLADGTNEISFHTGLGGLAPTTSNRRLHIENTKVSVENVSQLELFNKMSISTHTNHDQINNTNGSRKLYLISAGDLSLRTGYHETNKPEGDLIMNVGSGGITAYQDIKSNSSVNLNIGTDTKGFTNIYGDTIHATTKLIGSSIEGKANTQIDITTVDNTNINLTPNGTGETNINSHLSVDGIMGATNAKIGTTATAFGKLAVKPTDTAIFGGNATWTDEYTTIGEVDSETGLCVGIGINKANNYAVIKCIEPTTSWRPLYFSAGSLEFTHQGTERMSIAGNIVARTNINPDTTNTRNLGSKTNRFSDTHSERIRVFGTTGSTGSYIDLRGGGGYTNQGEGQETPPIYFNTGWYDGGLDRSELRRSMIIGTNQNRPVGETGNGGRNNIAFCCYDSGAVNAVGVDINHEKFRVGQKANYTSVSILPRETTCDLGEFNNGFKTLYVDDIIVEKNNIYYRVVNLPTTPTPTDYSTVYTLAYFNTLPVFLQGHTTTYDLSTLSNMTGGQDWTSLDNKGMILDIHIVAPVSGTFYLKHRTDDGCRVFLDDVLLTTLTSTGAVFPAPATWKSQSASDGYASFSITAGTEYKLTFQYVEGTQSAESSYSWNTTAIDDTYDTDWSAVIAGNEIGTADKNRNKIYTNTVDFPDKLTDKLLLYGNDYKIAVSSNSLDIITGVNITMKVGIINVLKMNSSAITAYKHIIPGTGNAQDIGEDTDPLGAGDENWFRNGFFSNLYVSNVAVTSDRTLKQNITDLEYGLDYIKKLKPKQYQYKSNKNGRLHWGFIAQDVKELNQNDLLSVWGLRPNGKQQLNYTEFISVICKAIQELDSKINRISKGEQTNDTDIKHNVSMSVVGLDDFKQVEEIREQGTNNQIRIDTLKMRVDNLENVASDKTNAPTESQIDDARISILEERINKLETKEHSGKGGDTDDESDGNMNVLDLIQQRIHELEKRNTKLEAKVKKQTGIINKLLKND